MDSDEDVKELLQGLKDERAPVRCTAAYELGKIGSEVAVEHLVALLEDDYISVRICAAEALGHICDKRAIRPLIEVVGNEGLGITDAAVTALQKITGQTFGNPGKWEVWFETMKSANAGSHHDSVE
ncbi:MAG: HEAT repeat domain-containing protein [Planctomycetota bacterium]